MQTCSRCQSSNSDTATTCQRCHANLKSQRKTGLRLPLRVMHASRGVGLLLPIGAAVVVIIALILKAHAAPSPQLCHVQGKNLGQIQQGQSVPATIPVGNCGDVSLNWQAQGNNSSSWLKLNKSSGTLAAKKDDQIPFTAVANSSDRGQLSTTINVTSNGGGSQQAQITMTVVPPPPSKAQLCYVEDTDLGAIPAGQSVPGAILFGNCGGQTLDWQAQDPSAPWLNINPSSGTLAPGKTDWTTFTVTTSPSDRGARSTLVMINSNGGSQQARVTMTVVPPSQPVPQAARLCNVHGVNLGQLQQGQSKPDAITFNNCGNQSLQWHAEFREGWRGVTPDQTSGNVAPNGTGQILVTPHVRSELPGTYTAIIFITSNGGSQAAPVTVQIGDSPSGGSQPPPQLCQIPDIDLGQAQPGQSRPGTISFGNCGGQDLKWQAQSNDPSRLQLNQSSGTVAPNGRDQIPLTMTANPSDQGLLSATINITSNGGNQQATVTMTVKGAGGGGGPQRRTIIGTDTQSRTVPTTGQRSIPGTQASGTIIIHYDGDDFLHLPAGTILTNTKGCIARGLQVSLDIPINLPDRESKEDHYSDITIPVHVVQPGAAGNIRDCSKDDLAFATVIHRYSKVFHIFSHGFAGGTNPRTDKIVTQGDIDNAVQALKEVTAPIAFAAVKSQLRSDEQPISVQFTYVVTANHVAGDHAATVTVTVQAICTAIAST